MTRMMPLLTARKRSPSDMIPSRLDMINYTCSSSVAGLVLDVMFGDWGRPDVVTASFMAFMAQHVGALSDWSGTRAYIMWGGVWQVDQGPTADAWLGLPSLTLSMLKAQCI